MIDLTIKVHQHYVTTKVRFWYNSDAYAEFCVCSHEFPLRALQEANGGQKDLWEASVAHLMDNHSDFPTFPYPAYLEVSLRYDEAGRCAVQSARYSEFQRGVVDFAPAFANSLASYDLQMKVLTRMATLIAERNAEELNKMILTLRAASGTGFKKLT